MTKTNLTIRIDQDLKAEMQQLAENLGMDLTTFITIYAKKAVREQRIPFEVSCDIPNKETKEVFEEVEKMKKDPTLGKGYTDVDEMISDVSGDIFNEETRKAINDVRNGRNLSRAYSSVDEMMNGLLDDED